MSKDANRLNFDLDEGVKNQFKSECYRHGLQMTDTARKFVSEFIAAAAKTKPGKEIKVVVKVGK